MYSYQIYSKNGMLKNYTWFESLNDMLHHFLQHHIPEEATEVIFMYGWLEMISYNPKEHTTQDITAGLYTDISNLIKEYIRQKDEVLANEKR